MGAVDDDADAIKCEMFWELFFEIDGILTDGIIDSIGSTDFFTGGEIG